MDRGLNGRRAALLALPLLSMACGTVAREENQIPAQTGLTADGGSGTQGATTGADSGAADAASDGGIKLDVEFATDGMMSAGDNGDQSGCDKVDFLFIIDNSGSMGDEQSNLVASFPLFIDTIQSTLDEAQDYHLMVLDVDPWVYEACPGICDSQPPPPAMCLGPMGECDPTLDLACILLCADLNPCELGGGFECGVTTPLECEDVLGAGVTYPRGQEATNADCNFSSGARYMDSSEPDLSAAFECAAGVGVGSWSETERPMEAMVQAVTASTPAAACNEGFLRDDAILVVTFITDESDDPSDSAGTVAGWKQALISAKNGDEEAIVVLGLFGDNDQPDGICQTPDMDSNDGAEAAPRLRQFVDSFGDKGFFGSVCAPSYDAFFQEAVGLIDTTCEEFIPPAG